VSDRPPLPEPEFWVLDAVAIPHTAEPTLSFRMRVRDHSEREVYTIALRAQIQLEASQRPHGEESRDRLRDVFGEPERWNDTARGVLWACRDVLVPSFRGSTKFELQVPCSTDLELATTRYFDAVADGHAPLAFHFSGSVIYADGPDRMQVARVPWHVTAQYALPVETWRGAAGSGGLVRLGGDTYAALREYAAGRALLSSDAAVADLLDAARTEAG
jgi:hypothetical protein